MFFEDDPCQPDNFRCNRVCPRIAKAEFRGGFFSRDFRWRFNGRAKWITQLAGVFPVGVVNAPELIIRLRSHGCAHAWQFITRGDSEDVSATQNARSVREVSGVWSRQRPGISRQWNEGESGINPWKLNPAQFRCPIRVRDSFFVLRLIDCTLRRWSS